MNAITTGGSRVYAPEEAEANYSLDGKSYKPLGKTSELNTMMPGKGTFNINFSPATARYVQVIVKPVMQIAEGKPGAGEQAWMFLDEIEVR